MAIQGSRSFQESCVDRIRHVLREHGYRGATFQRQTDGFARWVVSFNFQGRVYNIEIYENGPIMLSGEQLFEPYMPEEFESEEALRESFARRLDRYLGGGKWEGPDEPGFAESVKRSFRKLLRR